MDNAFLDKRRQRKLDTLPVCRDDILDQEFKKYTCKIVFENLKTVIPIKKTRHFDKVKYPILTNLGMNLLTFNQKQIHCLVTYVVFLVISNFTQNIIRDIKAKRLQGENLQSHYKNKLIT